MSNLSDRVSVSGKQIDATVDALVQRAESPEEIQELERYRSELHALLLKRAFAETLQGYQV
jgi:hypothetical protein